MLNIIKKYTRKIFFTILFQLYIQLVKLIGKFELWLTPTSENDLLFRNIPEFEYIGIGSVRTSSYYYYISKLKITVRVNDITKEISFGHFYRNENDCINWQSITFDEILISFPLEDLSVIIFNMELFDGYTFADS